MRNLAKIAGVVLSLAGAAGPARAADVAHGLAVAERWCAACHLVAPGQARLAADAPTFEAIAKTRTGEHLSAFLANPYPRMPNMSLSRDEIADLVAYIKSFGLAPGEQPPPEPPTPDNPDRPGNG